MPTKTQPIQEEKSSNLQLAAENLETSIPAIHDSEVVQTTISDVKHLRANHIFTLQRVIGNRAVEGLLHKHHIMQQTIMRSDGKGQKSRESKPKNAPRGTKPIDQTGLDKDQVHDIKDGVGAGPKDWTGISPEGHVITSDEDGNAVDNGPWEDYTHAQYHVPEWLWEALAGVALAAGSLALIVCFATGPCSFGALIGGLGYATALLILGLLRGKGGSESTVASKENDPEKDSKSNEVDAYA